MGWFLGFVVFTLIWWTTLFCVLPLGVQPREGSLDEGGWRGAPSQPRMLRKIVITTLLSAAIFGAVYALVESNLVSFRDPWLSIPD
jgi:predicted secreted protein